jgi:hypothetical protein
MKREYSKPTIHVEVMSLDMPIAGSCDAYDESLELRAQGWFVGGADSTCKIILGNNSNGDGFFGGGADTLCYHSHARTTFSS